MAAQLPIPVFQSLGEIYPAHTATRQASRWSDLVTEFESRYGAKPSHVVRAPGRVNILGEHVDYSLFPVLPAAIEQDIIIALRATSSESRTCRLANVLPSFSPCTFTLTPPTEGSTSWDVGLIPPKEGGGWENYVKVAILECLQRYFPANSSSTSPVGLDLLVSGTVPPGAGLSSSAAFVVGSVIMFLVANGLTTGVSKGDVVALAMASEHRMGLRTGGMDQAASALCLANSLLHLSFHPTLLPTPLPLPPSLAVVITNSLAPHALADSAPERYNLRVVEVLCASRLLLHAWGVDSARGLSGENGRIWLREALDHWVEQGDDDELYEKALADLPRVLGAGGRDKTGWTREDMIAASGMTAEDFTKTYLDFIPVRAERFHLYPRAYHTFQESLRVDRFAKICNDLATSGSTLPPVSSDPPTTDSRLAELGALLDGSHDSLRDKYDATVPEVERLRDLCKKHGALGARQTGGGWGGAVISLVPVSNVDEFVTAIKASYPPFATLSPTELDEAAFATLPGSGAGIYVVD